MSLMAWGDEAVKCISPHLYVMPPDWFVGEPDATETGMSGSEEGGRKRNGPMKLLANGK